MRTRRLVSLVLFMSLVPCLAVAARAGSNLKALAQAAVSEDAAERASAIASLRAAGPAGLDALFEEHADAIKHQLSAQGAGVGGPEWERLAAALDAVSQQKDSFTSHLYWYTDIEEAKRAARAAGKPILSLRLLGRLSDEFSCANSRFFRTALYSNTSVSKYLREHFILHWKSVRPAPVVTVDYGDGRKLVRTITGNSIHYVLDEEGWTVDALPGLYGPQAFMRELGRAEAGALASARMGGEERAQFLSGYYNRQALRLIDGLRGDVARTGVVLPEGAITRSGDVAVAKAAERAPLALVAAPLAVTKMAVEVRTVGSITYTPGKFERATDEAEWTKLAELHLAEARMDAASVGVVARHNPYVESSTKGQSALTAEQLARVVANFERRMALDTVRNEYLLRPSLLRWLTEGAGKLDVDKLNERVYAELFLTPDTDPWLGLLTPDTYTGLTNDGVISKK